MTTKRLALSLLTTGMLMFGAASCDVLDPYEPGSSGSTPTSESARPDERKISLNGHLRKLVEDGSTTWVFESDALVRYTIVDLPTPYQHDGLRVHIEAIVDNSSAIQGYGKRINLIDIDPIGTPAHPMTPSKTVTLR